MRWIYLVLEIAARLGMVAALLALLASSERAAIWAVCTSACVAARSWIEAELIARETERGWREAIGAIRARPTRELATWGEDETGVVTLIDSIHEVAIRRGIATPSLIGQAASVVVVAVLVGVRVPLLWALAALATAAAVLVALIPFQRRRREASNASFAALGPLARDVRALVMGAVEIRAARTDGTFEQRAREGARVVATSERLASKQGAALAMVPAAVAILAVLVPRTVLEPLARGGGLFELATLGVALVSSTLALSRTYDDRRRSQVSVDAFHRVVGRSKETPDTAINVGTARLPLRFDSVDIVHADGTVAPEGLSFALDRGRGAVLLGANGAGKSTALRTLLGLEAPSAGAVSGDGAPTRVAVLVQRPFVDPSASLRWHLGIVGVAPDSPELEAAMRRIGLQGLLERRSGGEPLSTPIGTLSGGERQRFFIARTMATKADLVIMDEPEAALDDRARTVLSGWLSEASKKQAVLLTAHDPSWIPAHFERIQVSASGAATSMTETLGARSRGPLDDDTRAAE